jgi:hypothetical protein
MPLLFCPAQAQVIFFPYLNTSDSQPGCWKTNFPSTRVIQTVEQAIIHGFLSLQPRIHA